MDPITMGAFALGSGIMSYFSQKSQAAQQRKLIEAYQAELDKAKISSTDKTIQVDRVGDQYNTGIISNTNNTALSLATRGVLNPQVTKLFQLGGATAGRQSAMINESNRINDYNANLEAEKRKAGLGKPANPTIFDALPAALEGAQLGANISDSLKLSESDNPIADKSVNPDNPDFGGQNRFNAQQLNPVWKRMRNLSFFNTTYFNNSFGQ